MPDTDTEYLQELFWEDVREEVYVVNPELAEVIDTLSPSKEFTLFKARYPFGSLIIDDGIFQVPINSKAVIPITSASISKDTQNKLGFFRDKNSIPMGLMLNNCSELFMKQSGLIKSFQLMQPGNIFGLWRALEYPSPYVYHPQYIWSMTAGARSLFLLPKISETNAHRRLKELGVRSKVPNNLLDQWAIFKQLTQHQSFPTPWECTMLFFSSKWLENRNDKAWTPFYYLLTDFAWKKSSFWRNKFIFDYVWNSFIDELADRQLRPSPQTVDTVKHLLVIATGNLPGFAPAIDNTAAPIAALQNIYVNIYGLKKYTPTIIQPAYVNTDRPIYYSLQLPTVFESFLKPKTATSLLEQLRDIKELMDEYFRIGKAGTLKGVAETPVQRIVHDIEFSYFHTESDNAIGIYPNQLMPQEDQYLVASANPQCKQVLSDVSPFLRACIRLKYNTVE